MLDPYLGANHRVQDRVTEERRGLKMRRDALTGCQDIGEFDRHSDVGACLGCYRQSIWQKQAMLIIGDNRTTTQRIPTGA
jgi:hypothetical protein